MNDLKIESEYTHLLALRTIEAAMSQDTQFDSWIDQLVGMVVEFEKKTVIMDLWELW